MQQLHLISFYRLLPVLVAVAMLAMTGMAHSTAANGTVKVGVLKFGTVNWELISMQRAGLDTGSGFDLEIVPYAGGEATEIALLGGAVDVIVSDWLWVARMRSEGVLLTFVPYSSSVGAVMVPAAGQITSLADLKGKKLGVAGGPLDKGWLLLQGMAKQEFGFDLAKESEIIYAAPPLLAEKTRTGELDAMLNYWHFCARLEAEGFKRLVSVADAAAVLGAEGAVSAIGYVFSDQWAAANPAAAAGFVRASRATKTLMNDSDELWLELGEEGVIKDTGTALSILRDRYREGIPDRSIGDEIADADRLYRILAKLGGPKLVGSSPTMMEGTYWPRLANEL